MLVTQEGQVTIPPNVRIALGIKPAETEVEFVEDENGRWYLAKAPVRDKSRFRKAHQVGLMRMTVKEIMALTR